MHLYDRGVRKFKNNLRLWNEYIEYLTERKCFNKLNRVISSAISMHPNSLDLWLKAVYNELDLKGNLFSSRKLML
jgi:U3 small nucleolar RNA-associated protein 6